MFPLVHTEDRQCISLRLGYVDHESTWHLRCHHLHSLALPETDQVDRGFTINRERRSLVARAVLISVFTILWNINNNFQRESTNSATCLRVPRANSIFLIISNRFICFWWTNERLPRNVYRNSSTSSQSKPSTESWLPDTRRNEIPAGMPPAQPLKRSKRRHNSVSPSHRRPRDCFSVSKHRASWHFCVALGSPPASLDQAARWESRVVHSYLCWSVNELTFGSFFCS